MFYCNDCAKKNGYPETMCKSVGNCELCGKHAVCNDMPSSKLPKPVSLQGDKKIDSIEFLAQEIETLAFEIFQEKLGLRFKKNLTVEEKKVISNVPEYQQYRNEALKVYNQRQAKKERAVFNKKYPVIKVEASGRPEWYKGARTLCFVYSKNHGNFVLEGYRGEVDEYLKKHYTHYFYYASMWHHGRSRGIWDFWKESIGIFSPSKRSKDWKYEVRPYSGSNNNLTEQEINEKTFRFKRLPKRWIPEFDKL